MDLNVTITGTISIVQGNDLKDALEVVTEAMDGLRGMGTFEGTAKLAGEATVEL